MNLNSSGYAITEKDRSLTIDDLLIRNAAWPGIQWLLCTLANPVEVSMKEYSDLNSRLRKTGKI